MFFGSMDHYDDDDDPPPHHHRHHHHHHHHDHDCVQARAGKVAISPSQPETPS